MRTAKPEITANTAVCDGAQGSISGVVDKIREKRALSHCADKMPCRQNAVPPKTTWGVFFLAKGDGRSRFLIFRGRNVRRIFSKQMQPLRSGWARRNARNGIRARNARQYERGKTGSSQSRLQYVHIARKARSREKRRSVSTQLCASARKRGRMPLQACCAAP